jgi:hypothetical protein
VLSITDGFPLGVGIGVLVLDDAARPLADKLSIQHEYRAVRLITPGFGKAPHLGSGLVPTQFWIAAGGLSSGRRPQRAEGERHCTRKEGSSADQQPFDGHYVSHVTASQM